MRSSLGSCCVENHRVAAHHRQKQHQVTGVSNWPTLFELYIWMHRTHGWLLLHNARVILWKGNSGQHALKKVQKLSLMKEPPCRKIGELCDHTNQEFIISLSLPQFVLLLTLNFASRSFLFVRWYNDLYLYLSLSLPLSLSLQRTDSFHSMCDLSLCTLLGKFFL